MDNHFDEMEELADTGSNSEINSYYFMGALIFDVLIQIVSRDGMLAIFSLVFVFIWLRINTGSFFLAGVGILEVFLSIPVAWFIFSAILQVKYFAFLNALSIFIVAGEFLTPICSHFRVGNFRSLIHTFRLLLQPSGPTIYLFSWTPTSKVNSAIPRTLYPWKNACPGFTGAQELLWQLLPQPLAQHSYVPLLPHWRMFNLSVFSRHV